jgi:hypothetical protein
MPKILPFLHHLILFFHSLSAFTQPALLLFLGMSIGLTLALYHILKTVTAKQKVDISLEKLSFLWKSQDEISLNLKEEIIEDIKAELGFGMIKKNKNRLKLRTKEDIETGVRLGIQSLQAEAENTDKVIDNKKLLVFYVKIEPYLKSDEQNNVVVRLLMFLDKKGNCPSVASSTKDTSTTAFQKSLTIIKNVTQYDIFRQITLTDHTLDVCEEALSSLLEKIKIRSEQESFIAPVMIACLAHDIGKVPDLSNTYATGDHPMISSRMLMDLGVPQNSDILNAVLNHHKVVADSSNTIYLMLKSADQAARAKELSEYLNAHSQDSQEFLKSVGVLGKNDTAQEIKQDIPLEKTEVAPQTVSPDSDLSFLTSKNSSPAVDSVHESNSVISNQVQTPDAPQNISLGFEEQSLSSNAGDYSWINIENYLSYLKPFINTYEVKNNQLIVQSVALTSGIIYFNTFCLGKALTDYMKSRGLEPLNYKTNKKETEDVLNYISKNLFENNLLDSRVNSGYYSNSVNIVQKNGNIINAFGILIKIEALGFMSASDVTANIPDGLKGITDIYIVKTKIKEQTDVVVPDIFS